MFVQQNPNRIPLRDRYCIFRGEVVIFLQSIVDWLSRGVQYVERISFTMIIHAACLIYSVGWTITFAGNPNYFADSTSLYILGKTPLTGYLIPLMAFLAIAHLIYLGLVSADITDPRSKMDRTHPDIMVNRPGLYHLGIYSLFIALPTWLLMACIINLPLIMGTGKSLAPNTGAYTALAVSSFVSMIVLKMNYVNSEKRRPVAVTMPGQVII
jgi:hypothetical protein